MQAFRAERPEIPHRSGRAQVRPGVALLGVNEVGEFHWIADEEHGGVVAHQIPIPFRGVVFHREAAHVALGVGRTLLASHGGEAGEHRRLLADGRKHVRPRIARQIVGDGQRAMGAPTLGMDRPLGDAFAVLIGELFQQLPILHQQWAARTGGQRVLVVSDWGAGSGGQFGRFGHGVFSYPAYRVGLSVSDDGQQWPRLTLLANE